MLVVTRKYGQGVVIYDEDGQEVAVVTVVKATQGKAQLGVTAHSHVKILRTELVEGFDEQSGKAAPNRSYHA